MRLTGRYAATHCTTIQESLIKFGIMPIPDDQDCEVLTFAATVRVAKADLPIAETSSLSWMALERSKALVADDF